MGAQAHHFVLTGSGRRATIPDMNQGRTAITAILTMFCLQSIAQEKVIRLYDGPAPGSENWKQTERENRTNLWQTRVVFNVASPTLTVFQPEVGKANGTAAIICPGGAFFALSIDSEGFDVARWLNAKGGHLLRAEVPPGGM